MNPEAVRGKIVSKFGLLKVGLSCSLSHINHQQREAHRGKHMRKCTLLFGAVLLFLLLIQVGVWAQERYVPKDNEELYGTWIDDAATGRAYKWVFNPEVMLEYWKNYEPPYVEQRYVKWVDDEGNAYYQLTARVSFQPWKEKSVFETLLWLIRIDASGSTCRAVLSETKMPTDFESGGILFRPWRRQ